MASWLRELPDVPIVSVTRVNDRESKDCMASLRAPHCLRSASFALAAALLCGPLPQLSGQSPTGHQASQPVPVLVELFTSEGCSDCPPADRILGELDARQPVSGVRAIVLSEHVTYWDRQGWRDPFSLDAMTDRQEQYARRFGLDSSFTPQMVVDGTTQFVGGNAKALVAALDKASETSKQPLKIEGARWDHGVAEFSIHGTASKDAKIFAALAIDVTHHEVSSGENKGRTLNHTAVVRAMKEFPGDAADGRPLKLAGGSLSDKNEASGPVRLVVFLVDRKTAHVLGATEQDLPR
jgi:hypothetical protein